MKTIYIQNITKTFSEDGTLLSTETRDSIALTPDEGKVLRDKFNGQIYRTTVTVSKKYKLDYFEEINEDKARK